MALTLIQKGRIYGSNLQLLEVSGMSSGSSVVISMYADFKVKGITASEDRKP